MSPLAAFTVRSIAASLARADSYSRVTVCTAPARPRRAFSRADFNSESAATMRGCSAP